MKRIVFIAFLLFLSKPIVSRDDDCDSQPRDPKKAAKCCSENNDLDYCELPSSSSAPKSLVGGGSRGSRHSGSFFPSRHLNFCHHSMCCWWCMFVYGYGTWRYWDCVWWYCRWWHPWQRLSKRKAQRAMSRGRSRSQAEDDS